MIAIDETDLAKSVATLEIHGRCGCRQRNCGTFYTRPRDEWLGRQLRQVIPRVRQVMAIDFLKNYEQIAEQLDGAAKAYLGDRGAADGRARRRLPNARLVEILYRSQRIDRALHRKLRDLITLSNAIIHGADPVVSEEMVKISTEAVHALNTALDKPVERRRLGRR